MGRVFEHPYRVIRCDLRGNILDELAQCAHFDLANACQKEAARIWPDDEIALQHGIRILGKMRGCGPI